MTHRHGLEQVTAMSTPCMACGSTHAVLLNTDLAFDFDAGVIPQDLRTTFTTRQDGICFDCGLYQEYARYSPSEMRLFCTFNKDETVSEAAYGEIPVPDTYVSQFEAQHMNQRIQRWDAYFSSRDLNPKRCLFLRPMFGATALYIKDRFDPAVYALEISRACRITTEKRVKDIAFLDGQIHGMLEGNFLGTGPYDLVFVFHTLIHCIDIRDSLAKLSELVSPGGAVILSHEIQLKPHNPFHMVFPTERQLRRLLSDYFQSIDRIDDCDPNPPPFISSYSINGDSPDLVVWAK